MPMRCEAAASRVVSPAYMLPGASAAMLHGLPPTTAGGMSRDVFIAAMRRVANSVTVVTTDGPAGRRGATVSAFCSVSADPPSVLVCLRVDSHIAGAVAGNEAFCVNVLPGSRSDIAERFAGRHDEQVADRFEGVDCQHDASGAPTIAGATGFSCVLRDTLDIGSHRVFVGHVVSAWEGDPKPLTYLDGAYHRVVPRADHQAGR